MPPSIMAAGFVRQALFFACVFAVHLLSEHEVLSAKNLERSDDIAFANFVRNFFHYLNGTKVGSHLVHAMGICGHMCMENLLCFSYNVAAQPDINGHFLCELLASDMYNSSDHLLPHPDFHHYSIKSSCSEKPCENGGTCIALYDEGDFKCKCRAGFKGKKCEEECPQGWLAFEESCYLFSSDKRSWHSASGRCQSLGASLVIIKSAGEDAFVVSHAGKGEIWIGLSDVSTEGNWVWVDGSPATYLPWYLPDGEPNGGRRENYGIIFYDRGRKWNDATGSDPCYYVCEK